VPNTQAGSRDLHDLIHRRGHLHRMGPNLPVLLDKVAEPAPPTREANRPRSSPMPRWPAQWDLNAVGTTGPGRGAGPAAGTGDEVKVNRPALGRVAGRRRHLERGPADDVLPLVGLNATVDDSPGSYTRRSINYRSSVFEQRVAVPSALEGGYPRRRNRAAGIAFLRCGNSPAMNTVACCHCGYPVLVEKARGHAVAWPRAFSTSTGYPQ